MRRLTWDSLSPLRRFGRSLFRRPSPSLSPKESPSVNPNLSNSPQPSLPRVQWSTTVSATTTQAYVSSRLYEPVAVPPLLPTERRETPVIGYRGWYCGAGRLGSVSAGRIWNPGVNEAECVLGRGIPDLSGRGGFGQDHEAPVDFCTCGLHLIRHFGQVMFLSGLPAMWPVVLGACMAWGKVVEHGHQGYRVQYAQVVALLESPYEGDPACNKLLRDTAERYGVPLLKQDAFLRHAAEFGEPLP